MVTQGANVRRGVQVVSSLMLTLQIFAIAGTIVFYLYANKAETRYDLEREIIKRLYDREDWKWMRRSGALQFHILVSLAVQILLAAPTALLLAGASRSRFLLLPWLVVFGLFQLAMFASVVLCVASLPNQFKVLGAAVAAIEAFIIFPWWFSVLHLFAVLSREDEFATSEAGLAAYLELKARASSTNYSAAHSWSYGDNRSSSNRGNHGGGNPHHDGDCCYCSLGRPPGGGRSSSATKISEV